MMSTLMHYRAKRRYALHAYVVMPDHVHLLLTPAAEVSLEKAIQFIRGGFSFRLKSKLDVWERRHFDKRLENGENYRACVAYIEENPVKARIVTFAAEYPFSSASRDDLDSMPAWLRAMPGAEAHSRQVRVPRAQARCYSQKRSRDPVQTLTR